MNKKLHASKTLWFGLALILLDMVPQVQGLLAEAFPAEMAQYGVAIIGAVVIGLRFATRKPIEIGRK